MADDSAVRAASERNSAAFSAILPELLRTHAGRFALMRDGKIVQFFNTDVDAMDFGDRTYVDDLCSVHEVSLSGLDGSLGAAPEVMPEPAPEAPAAPEPAVLVDNPMRVVVFASQKGGAGKTTLCGHVAVQADLVNAGPVALIDTDPQGSLADWWNTRQAETPLFVGTHFANLGSDLDELRNQGILLVFIDTPPAVTDTIREVVGHADLVVIPTRPSPHDLRAVGATVDIVEDRDKQMIFAVNAATVRAKITGEAAVALSQHGTVAPVTVHQRIDFATSMIDGRTVMEMNPESRSANEISALWQYIATRLGKLERRMVQQPYTAPDRRTRPHAAGFGQGPQVRTFGRRVTE
jgi:chromosome partitioning protein